MLNKFISLTRTNNLYLWRVQKWIQEKMDGEYFKYPLSERKENSLYSFKKRE
jgi:hypothetical protein